jgi:hypothetical protein
MKKPLPSVILCVIAAAFLPHCGKKVVKQPLPSISVDYEKLMVTPLRGFETLSKIEGWPTDSGQISALTAELEQVREEFLGELRRCEKYGNYTVVDSLLGPTVIISPRLAFRFIRHDTLYMPLFLEVENRASGKKYSVEIAAFGKLGPPSPTVPTLHRLGLALASYRRDFPYSRTVSLFHPGKGDKMGKKKK